MGFGELRSVGDGCRSRSGTPVECPGDFATGAKRILGETSFILTEIANYYYYYYYHEIVHKVHK